MPLDLIYAGTPAFAVPALHRLVADGHRVLAVYTQPDRPAGRGRRLTASAVKQAALALTIPVLQPESLKTPSAQTELAAFGAAAMVVAAYGLILPKAVLVIPRLGCLNIHASLLPRWRGAAPIQRGIAAGDARTGVTIMQMAAGLDTGDMLLQRTTPIADTDTGGVLHDRLAQLGAAAISDALKGLAIGAITPEPQVAALSTYAAKLSKHEAVLDWRQPTEVLARKIRAFNPWPVCETRYRGKTMRVWAAQAVDAGIDAAPLGLIVRADRAGLVAATGQGGLAITRLQWPGRQPISAADFLNTQTPLGVVLGE